MELVVVIAVAVIVISALTFATIGSLRNAQFAKNQAQATKLAQEGLERVRTGRDRNADILPAGALGSVVSWNGNGSADSAIWDYQINVNCIPDCYFKVTDQSVLNYLIASSAFPGGAEAIPPPPATAIFHRVIILSDDATYETQKKVTSIVRWTDFSGEHESKLTTILRNPNL